MICEITGNEMPETNEAPNEWFMVVSNDRSEFVGFAFAIFETIAEAKRYQLANGLRASTEIVTM